MNPETQAWQHLRAHAASRIRPGFADRVLRAARRAVGPSPWSQFAFGAATAVLCLVAIAFFQIRQNQSQRAQSVAAWQEVTLAADDVPAQ